MFATAVVIAIFICLCMGMYYKEKYSVEKIPCFRNYKLEGIPNIQAPASYILDDVMNRKGTTYDIPYSKLYQYKNDDYATDYLSYRTMYSPFIQLGGCAPQWLYNPYMTLNK